MQGREPEPQEASGLGTGVVTLLAVASGACGANNYYYQPLLPLMAHEFGAGARAVAAVPMMMMVGSATALLLLMPLGDVIDRKRLILALFAAAAAGLVGSGVAPGLTALAVASFLVGWAAVVPHVIVAFAAHLATETNRGKVITSVMFGTLVGVLLARAASGSIGALLGWRVVYFMSAAIMIASALALWSRLPRQSPTIRLRYRELFSSLVALARAHPRLRESCLIATASVGAFTLFWTTFAFFLAGPPHHRGSEVAGGFGLLSVSSVLGAPVVGRLADRNRAGLTVGVTLALALASFAIFYGLRDRMWALALGVVLLDMGMQLSHLANLTRVQALDPAARSRLSTVYMAGYFGGAVIGSLAGPFAWSAWGWSGVCAVGAGFVVAAIGLWAAGGRRAAAPARAAAGTS